MKRVTVALSCAILAVALFANPVPSEAQTSSSGRLDFTGYKVAIILGAVAVVTIVVVAVHMSAGKRTISGCVRSDANGLELTDDKDKQIYLVAGDTGALKPGERMTLRVKKRKTRGGAGAANWETLKVKKDLGVCQP